MRRPITAVLATAALVLTGCGSDEPDSAGTEDSPSATRSPEPTPSPEPEPTRSPSPEPSPQPSSEPEPEPPPEPTESPEPQTSVDNVTMTRSGGFAGISQTWEVGPSDPGHRAVFAAASPEALEGAEGSTGKPPCCDLFQSRLTVSYSDGAVESFQLYDGGPADPALTRLMNAVLKTQPQASDSPTLR